MRVLGIPPSNPKRSTRHTDSFYPLLPKILLPLIMNSSCKVDPKLFETPKKVEGPLVVLTRHSFLWFGIPFKISSKDDYNDLFSFHSRRFIESIGVSCHSSPQDLYLVSPREIGVTGDEPDFLSHFVVVLPREFCNNMSFLFT